MRAGCYILAHFLGSICTSGVLMGVMGLRAETMGGFNATSGPEDSEVAQAFITEMMLTFTLCFTVLATVDPGRKDVSSGYCLLDRRVP